MKPIHVTIIPSLYPMTYRPSGGIFVKEQAEALHKAGLKVGVIYPALRPWTSLDRFKDLWTENCRVFESRASGFPELYWRTWTAPRFWRLKRNLFHAGAREIFKQYIKKFGPPDLIHAHGAILAGEFCASHLQSFGAPYLLTEHLSTIMTDNLDDWQKAMLQQATKSATEVIAVSRGLADRMHRLFDRSTKVVPNVVNVDFFQPMQSKRSDETFTFSSLGILTPRKNMNLVIQAFTRAFAGNDRYRLIIAGDGPERFKLQQQAANSLARQQIQFCGSLSREGVRDLFQRSDCFVLASSYETFGVVIIEALACGVPVIASNIEGPRDIVTDEVGRLFESGSLSDLTQKMMEVASQARSFKSCRSYVARHFSAPVVADKLVHIYQSIVGESRSR